MLASIVQRCPVMLVSAFEIGSLMVLNLQLLVLFVVIVIRIPFFQQGQFFCKIAPLPIDPSLKLLRCALEHNFDYRGMQIRVFLLIQVPLDNLRSQERGFLHNSSRPGRFRLSEPAILHLLLLALTLLPCHRHHLGCHLTIQSSLTIAMELAL